MRKYETTFIVDGLLHDEERETVIQWFENLLEKNGGEIDRIVRWGLRGLAYDIKKRTRGYYVIFYYNANPSVIATLHRELDINERILRYLTIMSEGKHPEYIRDQGLPSPDSSLSQRPPEIIKNSVLPEEKPIIIDSPVSGEEQEDDDLHTDTAIDEEQKTIAESHVDDETEADDDSDKVHDENKENNE